jgi:hypothetical protein
LRLRLGRDLELYVLRDEDGGANLTFVLRLILVGSEFWDRFGLGHWR